LGKFPNKKIIQTSNTAELAVGFGRKVRNLVDEAPYRTVFPNTTLQSDSKAAGRWNTSKGGDYFAIGVGGTVTGKGADLLIIDDPHSEQESRAAESNPEIYDGVYEWYTSGPRQRLQPGGAIVIVMCMTGDTDVLMADGTTTKLRDIVPGSKIATYEKGRLSSTVVVGHRSNGVDDVYEVQTRSGKLLHANERHPFLVELAEGCKWIRLKDLKPGMSLVATRGATAPRGLARTPAYADPVKRLSHTTKETQTRHIAQWGFTVSGRVKRAVQKGVKSLFIATGYAPPTTIFSIGLPGEGDRRPQLNTGTGLKADTGLLKRILTTFSKAKMGFARSVDNRLRQLILAHIGMESSASTTTTAPEKFAGYSATTAILLRGMRKLRQLPMQWLNISDFILDPIISITPSGREEVFDVEIGRTHNFIANGVVSHNTRWSKRDLTAQVLKAAAQRDGEEWEVIEFPAIMPSGNPVWPEFWPLAELEVLRNELPYSKWMAQYMQDPTSEASAIVKREWWQVWEKDDPPECEFVLMSWDTAFEKHNRADYSACTTWGVFYRADDGTDPEVSASEKGKMQAHIILLNAFRDRMEFPELKRVAIAQYKEWSPDGVIIEKKASGAPLIYEMRAMGIPVQEFTPTKGNDKISRLNAVSDIFASGRVWAPETRWAEEVIEEVASFPAGEHDDYVDSVSMALMRFRKGGYIRTALDEDEMALYPRNPNRKPYY
jgi:predicted phage terminase large subunit-like protein